MATDGVLITPGPWRLVAGGFVQAPRRRGTDQHDIDIARLYGFDADARMFDGFYAGEPLANGQAIAAVPDLVAALQESLARLEAIAKIHPRVSDERERLRARVALGRAGVRP